MVATGELNLRPTRGPNVWEKETLRPHRTVLDLRSWTTVLAGSGLAILGLTRRSVGGSLLALAGMTLAYRAMIGHDDLSRAGRALEQIVASWRGVDVVEEASEESFPASDAPGWNQGRDER